jgi:signal transduction histidine kinase
MLEVYHQMRSIGEGVELSIGDEDQAVVLGDADRLKQLLLNLVDNARKYTPKGGKVTLGLRRAGGWAQLSVADTGLGIPAQDLPHIFERFYRVDKARSRVAGGTGLGLSIAKHIVLAHQGTISVKSRLGEGTTFTVSLPIS